MVYVTVRAVTYGFLLKSTVFQGSVLELYIRKQILELSLKQLTASLESGIYVPPWASGKFGKKNKRSPIYTLYLYYLNRLYEVRNKVIAPGKKSKK